MQRKFALTHLVPFESVNVVFNWWVVTGCDYSRSMIFFLVDFTWSSGKGRICKHYIKIIVVFSPMLFAHKGSDCFRELKLSV